MDTLFFLLEAGKWVELKNYNLAKDVHRMIREIYSSMVSKDNNGDKISQEIKNEIVDLLKIKEGKMNSQEYRQYKDELLLIASAAEESGFVSGFRFAFRLFAEIIQE